MNASATPNTTEHSLRTLAKVIVSRLENAQHVEFNPAKRNDLRDSFFTLLGGLMLTEQALSQMVRDQIGAQSSNIADANITETEAYRMRRKALKEDYDDNAIAGFYLRAPLREVVAKAAAFFLKSPLVDEVFADDQTLHRLIQDTISTFDESKVA